METQKKKMLLADVSLLVVAVVWGTGFIVTKNAVNEITPLFLVALRFLVATAVIGIFSVNKLKGLSRTDIAGGLIVGLMLYLGFATQTIGIQYTTAGKSAFLTGTNVVMVPFISWILYKRRPGMTAFIAAGLCFIGVSFLTSGADFTTISAGDYWTLACACAFAMHIVTTGIFVKKVDPVLLTFLQFFVVSVLGIISSLIWESPVTLPPQDALGSVLFLGVLGTCMAFFIQTLAQKYTTATHAAIILSLESMFGTLFGILLLSETFTSVMGVGCLFILLSVITAETGWSFLRKKKINKSQEYVA